MRRQASASRKKEILTGMAQHVGYGRNRVLEDRCTAQRIITAGGTEITLGIVVDGLGGNRAGDRASQIAIDAILQYIQAAENTEFLTIIDEAIQVAHTAIVKALETDSSVSLMGATAVVAVIYNQHLYLGHIGDSRAYLVRGRKIRQLTMDHTWENIQLQVREKSRDEILNSSQRGKLMFFVGRPDVDRAPVDLGYRLIKGSRSAQSRLIQAPLKLKPGDVVVLCSDGLTRLLPHSGERYVEDAEIANAVLAKKPYEAAMELVHLALYRQVDDNVSVVVLEVPGRKSSPPVLTAGVRRKIAPTIGLAALAGLFVALIIWGVMNVHVPQPGQLITLQKSPGVQPILSGDEVRTLEGSVLRYQVAGSEESSSKENGRIPVGEGVWVWTEENTTGGFSNENNWKAILGNGTKLNLVSLSELRLETGSVLVEGSELLITTKSGYQVKLEEDGKVGVSYDPEDNDRLIVDCLASQCSVKAYGNIHPRTFAQGERYEFQRGKTVVRGRRISGQQWDTWIKLGGGEIPIPTFTPTPTFTATPTPPPTQTATAMPTMTSPVIPTKTKTKPNKTPIIPNPPSPTQTSSPTG